MLNVPPIEEQVQVEVQGKRELIGAILSVEPGVFTTIVLHRAKGDTFYRFDWREWRRSISNKRLQRGYPQELQEKYLREAARKVSKLPTEFFQ